MPKPFVSVLIDTYNHERFIEQAITSVLEQSMPMSEVEVIVVDDGSTDRTPELVRRFEPRVRLLRKTNGGQGSAFNAGIPECNGEIIAFLDGDDWWADRKLARVIAEFEANPGIGTVGHGTIALYDDGREHTEVLKEKARFSLQSIEGARMFRLRKNFMGTRIAARAALLRCLLPVPEEIRIEADEFVFTMAAALGDVCILPEALFFYRIHGANHFSLDAFDDARARRKQQNLALLAAQLAARLRAISVRDDVIRCVIHAVEIEAAQLRLAVEGGYPWETVHTEAAMYRLLHGDASWSHRLFKYGTLFPAYFLPPRLYYGARRWLAARSLYLRLRKKILPIPQPKHTVREWKTGT